MFNENHMMVRMALESGNVVHAQSIVNDPAKLREIMDLKQFVLGNARLLYGSEARKFFDFVLATDTEGKFTCILVCSLDGSTKILRKEVGPNALNAVRALADGLVKDTGILLMKYDVGDQIRDQQGFRNEDGKFELDKTQTVSRTHGPADDTSTLRTRCFDAYVPRGPKRGRLEYD